LSTTIAQTSPVTAGSASRGVVSYSEHIEQSGVEMRRILIVANRTVGGAELETAVRQRLHDGPCEFHLVVPVASPVAAAVAVGATAANMSETAAYEVPNEHRIAKERLDYGLEWLAALGASATGELSTDSDTGAAVARIVDGGFDEVIVSTLPTTVSRWLHQDLPCRIGRKVSVPVCVVSKAG
jgi:hypothetical protein